MPKRRYRMEKPRHLYLVPDDWPWGYGIRELDLLSDAADADQHLTPAGAAAPEHPTPASSHRLPFPIFRFEAERGEPSYFAGAFGSKILATHPILSSAARRWPANGCGVPVYDVRTRSFMLAPRRPPPPVSCPVVYVPAGGRLLALAADGAFEALHPPPRDDDAAAWVRGSAWAWRRVPADLPFRPEDVACHAVHPDGRTLFVSVAGGGGALADTLSFDAAKSVFRDGEGKWSSSSDGDGCEWKRRGQWQLPFAGRGYYDSGLDAWVGLSGDPGTIGHLCSCDVVSTDDEGDDYDDDAGNKQCPAVKVSKEKLFSEVPAERHIGATLVYMGDGGKFCLIECVYIVQADEEVTNPDADDEKNEEVTEEEVRERFIRLTTFSVRYGKSGDLTTGNSRRLRYYSVPEEVTEPMLERPVEFWM